VSDGADTQRDEAEVRRFVERFALTMVETGMPRMPARVFAALLASEEGKLAAAELASALHVSPAAISGAVRYLAQVGMIARERDPGERRDHYVVYEDLWSAMSVQRDQALARWVKDLASGVDAVGAATSAGRRLDETRQYFEFLREEMPRLMARWQAAQRDR
jgi:DNA-binding transcriptional regulator GbsR (MarR family)